MPYARAYRRVEQEFKRLNDQLSAGHITLEQFNTALKELLVQDAQGRYWTIGVRSGKWYVNDGSRWIEGTPPDEPAENSPAPPASPPPSIAATSLELALPTVPRSPRLWLAGGLAAILVLCLCICTSLVLTGALAPILDNSRGLLGFP